MFSQHLGESIGDPAVIELVASLPLPSEDCLDICPPSNYYEFKEQLEEWFRRIVGS